MSLAQLFEPIIVLLRPLLILSISLSFLPSTIAKLITTNPGILSSWSGIKDAWFGHFWNYFGPMSREVAAPFVTPLLNSHATGVVIDVGSGQGHFLHLYPKEQITKIYAVEPNKSHHKDLLANAKAAGLLEKNQFEIVDAYIETLSSAGIAKGSIDTICTLQTLCSIPNPEVLITELRTYLKEGGGKWIVFEHVRREERHGFLVLYQRLLNVIWPEVLNGCTLTRKTGEWIERTGGWQKQGAPNNGKLVSLQEENPYSVIPHIHGVLISE